MFNCVLNTTPPCAKVNNGLMWYIYVSFNPNVVDIPEKLVAV